LPVAYRPSCDAILLRSGIVSQLKAAAGAWWSELGPSFEGRTTILQLHGCDLPYGLFFEPIDL
jgi:hypothetical protein